MTIEDVYFSIVSPSTLKHWVSMLKVVVEQALTS